MWTPGQVIAGKYRLLKRLGGGALGENWGVRGEGAPADQALKIVTPGWSVSASSYQRFVEDVRAYSGVRDACLTRVDEVDLTGDPIPFVVMELLSGEHLESLLTRERLLPPGTALAVVALLAKALSKVHARGLVHQRVEPRNVFLHLENGSVIPKLLNFGVARLVERGSSFGAGARYDAISPLGYLAPEQLASDVVVDDHADVYALGVLLHRCLVGREPWDGVTPASIIQQIEEGARLDEYEPQLDAHIIHLVEDCLQRNRRLRPTMRVLGERLESLVARYDNHWEELSRRVRIVSPGKPEPPRLQTPPSALDGRRGAMRAGWLAARGPTPRPPPARPRLPESIPIPISTEDETFDAERTDIQQGRPWEDHEKESLPAAVAVPSLRASSARAAPMPSQPGLALASPEEATQQYTPDWLEETRVLRRTNYFALFAVGLIGFSILVVSVILASARTPAPISVVSASVETPSGSLPTSPAGPGSQSPVAGTRTSPETASLSGGDGGRGAGEDRTGATGRNKGKSADSDVTGTHKPLRTVPAKTGNPPREGATTASPPHLSPSAPSSRLGEATPASGARPKSNGRPGAGEVDRAGF